MFTPDLDLRVATRCTIFQVQDKTGVDTGAGDKWSGVAGLDPSTLTAAVVRVINPSGDYTDHDILSQIPVPVLDSFWFNDMTGTGVDGLHNLVYTLKSTDITITAFADYGSTITGTVKATSVAHDLETGMYVTIAASTSYNGQFLVTRIDADNFYFTAVWLSDDGSTAATITYKSTFYPYVYCRAEAGIDKMFAIVSRMIPGPERTSYLDDANTAKGLLWALRSAMTSSNVDALDAILAEINQILSYYEVDANI